MLIAHQFNRKDTWNSLELGLETVPRFTRFGSAGKAVIRAIHSIQDLEHPRHGYISLGRVEIYLGRAGATYKHLSSRWRTHNKTKKHCYGMVVCLCPTSKVQIFESAAIRVLNRLRDKGRLCVKNIEMRGGGSLPAVSDSCIYITWRVVPERNLTLPKRSDIADIAYHVEDEHINVGQLKRTLDLITRPTREKELINWLVWLEENVL